MYGAANGGVTLGGHVLKATFSPGGTSMPTWQDVTLSPVSNDSRGMNFYGLDISSIYIDPHDATGNTVYVTVEGIHNPLEAVRVAYRTTDGGANWAFIDSRSAGSPANSIVVDPQDANTVYLARDDGVYSTREIATCATAAWNCWSAYGTGLPSAPVLQLSAAPVTGSLSVLAAATYGRGVWQIPLWTAGTQITTATVAPSSLTFASQTFGSSSSAQTVTLTNTGAIALTPTAIAVSGDFRETDSCVHANVNAGTSCAIQVIFTPTHTGSRSGQLTISANVDGGQLTVDLSGTGTSSGLVSLAPSTQDFGQVEVGKTSSALQVTAENGTGAAIPVTSVSVTAPFLLASNACGDSLAANSDCEMAVEFAPTQAGPASGTLTIIDGAGTQTVTLSGTGAAPATDTLTPVTLSFPATVMGQLSAGQSVALTNDGDLALHSITETVTAGFQTTSNCGTMLGPHATCSITVVFAPTLVGSQTGTLSVNDEKQTQTVALSGTGLQPPAFGVSPAQLSFPVQAVGVASAPITLTVSDSGGAPMASVGFQITGSATSSFSTGTTTCGATLNKGSSCTVQVVFTPTVAGVNGATLTVTSSTLGVVAVQVPLSGIGQAISGISISPAQMLFTQSTLGQASAAQIATITNTSAMTAGGLTVSVGSPFNLTQNRCGTSLAPGASCTSGVVFIPTANGVVTGTLSAGSPAFANPAVLALSGAGGAAGSAQMQPALLSFSTTGVGTVSSAQIVTVTNSSTVTLTDLALSASSGFQVTSTTCAATLAPGANCTAAVAFAPATAGQQTGNLTIASSMLAVSAKVPLSGMGLDFSASVTGGSSQTVSSGQTARYTLALSPLNGSAGTFTFTCGTLPANAICTFNPTSEAVAANPTGSATVQIATGQATSAQLILPAGGAVRWRILPMACGLLLLPLAWARRRRVLLLVVLALMFAGVTSCAGAGGGSGGSTPPPSTSHVTPAGTYSVAVSVTASGVTHKVTVSLTVD
jgi:Abnormal spindle-like microcephaly-assoc'd, ASPM-SPD-2-Hydin